MFATCQMKTNAILTSLYLSNNRVTAKGSLACQNSEDHDTGPQQRITASEFICGSESKGTQQQKQYQQDSRVGQVRRTSQLRDANNSPTTKLGWRRQGRPHTRPTLGLLHEIRLTGSICLQSSNGAINHRRRSRRSDLQ